MLVRVQVPPLALFTKRLISNEISRFVLPGLT